MTIRAKELDVGKTVCVIEDDELVRARLCDLLRADGHTVLEAESADQGIDLIRTERADVAIVDILMPDRDGLEAIGQLRMPFTGSPTAYSPILGSSK